MVSDHQALFPSDVADSNAVIGLCRNGSRHISNELVLMLVDGVHTGHC